MKILPLTLLAALLPAAILPAAPPKKDKPADPHSTQVADFAARVAYAKTHADPVMHEHKGGTLSCIVYTVKQGPGGSPGFTFVIATDTGFAPMDDLAVLCDTVEIDPAHSIKCSGHVVFVQSGWIGIGGDGMTLTLGLGKKDRQVKIAGPHKSDPI